MAQYSKLLEEAFYLSKTNRAVSDAKTAEAAALLEKIEKIIE